jgi:hypothetical protein
MAQFLEFLARQRMGIAVLFGSLLLLIFLIQWLAWVFAWGRFEKTLAKPGEQTSQLRFVIASLFVKIIDEFRHLLALLVVLIFAGTLAAVLVWAPYFSNVKEGLQAVVASLGGLVGSILGYYFGESKARNLPAPPSDGSAGSPPAGQPAVQGTPVPEIRPVNTPAGAKIE